VSCGHIIDHYLRESIKEEINPRCQKKKFKALKVKQREYEKNITIDI
jgi:hypothetical protein